MYIIEFPFSKIIRLHSTVYYRIKLSTTNPFFGVAGFLKVFENLDNVQEKLCYVVPFSKLQVFKLQPTTLPCMFLKFWKIPEITCAVEFLFTEAGANRFSTECCSEELFGKIPGRHASAYKKNSILDVSQESMQSVQKCLEQLFFQNRMDGCFRKLK